MVHILVHVLANLTIQLHDVHDNTLCHTWLRYSILEANALDIDLEDVRLERAMANRRKERTAPPDVEFQNSVNHARFARSPFTYALDVWITRIASTPADPRSLWAGCYGRHTRPVSNARVSSELSLAAWTPAIRRTAYWVRMSSQSSDFGVVAFGCIRAIRAFKASLWSTFLGCS